MKEPTKTTCSQRHRSAKAGGGWTEKDQKAAKQAAPHPTKRREPGGAGRSWKTMLHHFQDPRGRFRRVSEVTYKDPRAYEVKFTKTTPARAAAEELRQIRRLKPRDNVLGLPPEPDPWDAPTVTNPRRLSPAELTKKLEKAEAELARLKACMKKPKPAVRPLRRAPPRDDDDIPRISVKNPSKPNVRRWLEYLNAARKTKTSTFVGSPASSPKRKSRAANDNPPATEREKGHKAYVASHWGNKGRRPRGRKLHIPAIQACPEHPEEVRIIELGLWEEGVTYSTRKEDEPLTNFVHPWGDGIPAKKVKPQTICWHDCDVPGCEDQGCIITAAGSARVDPARGIVG